MQNNKQCNRLKPKPMAIDVGGKCPTNSVFQKCNTWC